jgi:phage repressor protein C with HTH and peptisase S24 domain
MPGTVEDDIELVRDLVKWTGTNVNQISKRIGVVNTTLNRFNNGSAKTRLHRDTLAKLRAEFPDYPGFEKDSDAPANWDNPDYVPVEVLPTYAGQGGGGTGDGDRETALIPRALIEDVLRGKPDNFLLINVRGDSMEPDFHHGDQLLVDCRDRSPAQPGPFALWDGEWGEYVVKNVERSNSGEVRIFSSNTKYSSAIVETEQTRIIGRPVWFGRRL